MERVPSLLGERFGELNLGAAIPLPERMELVDLDKESACLVGEGGPVETFQLAVALQAIEDPLCLGRDPRLGGEVMIWPSLILPLGKHPQAGPRLARPVVDVLEDEAVRLTEALEGEGPCPRALDSDVGQSILDEAGLRPL